MHQLTFLFAALHARQAVEFFFGLLTAVDVCGANMRGGPGASAGNCFVFSWGVIFILKRSALRTMVAKKLWFEMSDRNIPRLKLRQCESVDEATLDVSSGAGGRSSIQH